MTRPIQGQTMQALGQSVSISVPLQMSPQAYQTLRSSLLGTPLLGEDEARDLVDRTLTGPESFAEIISKLIWGEEPAYALALLERAPAERLATVERREIAELLRLEDTALRLAAMPVATRHATGAEPTEPGGTQSLELRQARRYVEGRMHGHTLVHTPYNLAEMHEAQAVVVQECACDYCGTLYLWEQPENGWYPGGRVSDWPKCPESECHLKGWQPDEDYTGCALTHLDTRVEIARGTKKPERMGFLGRTMGKVAGYALEAAREFEEAHYKMKAAAPKQGPGTPWPAKSARPAPDPHARKGGRR